MAPTEGWRRGRRILGAVLFQVGLVAVTLVAVELVLRVIDLRYLRSAEELERQAGGPGSRDMLLFRQDPEIGWTPVPNSTATYVASRPITVHHNSLGIRDIEPDGTRKPTILFLGDSLVWGFDVEADERFTEMIRREWPQYRIVNAGVSGFGTDQEFLFLKRLWNDINPDVVVLVFSVDTDRKDNTSNARYDSHYKPYFVLSPDGELQVRGQPVAHSRHYYFSQNWFARRFLLARVAVSAYLLVGEGRVTVPDPTEPLVDAIRTFVESHGAKFLVGMQESEPQLAAFLDARHVPHVSFDGAERYATHGGHWTPRGHELVAARLMRLLRDSGAVEVDTSAEVVGSTR